MTVSTTDFMTTAGVTDPGGKAAWLFNTYAPSIHQSGNGTDAAALQVAIWEAISDNVPNLSLGGFTLIGSPAIASEAQTLLNALFSGPGGYYTSTAPRPDAPAGRGQDQMLASGTDDHDGRRPGADVSLPRASGLFMLAHRVRRRPAAQPDAA